MAAFSDADKKAGRVFALNGVIQDSAGSGDVRYEVLRIFNGEQFGGVGIHRPAYRLGYLKNHFLGDGRVGRVGQLGDIVDVAGRIREPGDIGKGDIKNTIFGI